MCKCGCDKCETVSTALVLNESKAPASILSEGLKHHMDANKPLTNNFYSAGSKDYFDLIAEARSLYSRGILDFTNKRDIELLTETDQGYFGIYEGKKVPLDFPMLTEASGSWLTKNIFDALNKELKRIEPNMYRNEHFQKAFSVYLHDLDSIEYSKLGQNRFKYLDKAWDYIDKHTDALSSTNDKLNRRHIRSQLDGPVYAMLKHNRYDLKENKSYKIYIKGNKVGEIKKLNFKSKKLLNEYINKK